MGERLIADETIEQIQTKIAFLERANADLSDVVFRQQREIRALGARIVELAERLETAQSDDRQRPPEDERPPHY
jgi:SlyX protein